MWALRRCALVVAATVVPTGVAVAGELDYRVAEDCPDAESFDQVLAARGATLDDSSLAVDISVIRGGDVFEGSLRLRTGDELHAVAGSSCDKVVDALALVLALAIEADRQAVDEASQVAMAEPDLSTSDSSQAPPALEVSRSAPSPDDEEGRARLFVGAHALGITGVLPGGAIAAQVFVELPTAWPLRLALSRAEEEMPVSGGSAAFRWTAGRLDLCPFARDGRVSFAGCATAEGGMTRVVTRGVPEARQVGRPWISAGSAMRTGLNAGRLRFEAEAAALAPIRRDHYQLRPSMTVHRTSWVSARLGIGLAVQIW